MSLGHFDSLFDGIVPSLARILTKQHGIRGGGEYLLKTPENAISETLNFKMSLDATALKNLCLEFTERLNEKCDCASVRSQSKDNIPYNDDLNVAFVGASARDLENQAKDLVSRLKNMKNIDYGNDWKLLTMWIGTEDLCQVCTDMVPCLFVNLVPPMDVSLMNYMEDLPSPVKSWAGIHASA
ncbi:unnamed protein product [Porites lobata]|uniref:Uncharacterized protein n=1 Tax=Porites lobata TaxID=104759 RepID=A0ABN8PDC2_9CNID|nr:unnamed protein product [Porites lobata]